MIGMWGLFFFMVGYALVRNDLRYMSPGVPGWRCSVVPCSGALLPCLGEQKSHLPEAFDEGIFARHDGDVLFLDWTESDPPKPIIYAPSELKGRVPGDISLSSV